MEGEECDHLALERNHIIRLITLKQYITLAREREKWVEDDRVFEIHLEDTELIDKHLSDLSNIDILERIDVTNESWQL